MPTNNIDGVVKRPPPPAIESINEASIEIPKRNKYTVSMLLVMSIKKFRNFYLFI